MLRKTLLGLLFILLIVLQFYSLKLFFIAFGAVIIFFLWKTNNIIKNLQENGYGAEGIVVGAGEGKQFSSAKEVEFSPLIGNKVRGTAYIKVYSAVETMPDKKVSIVYDPQMPERFLIVDEIPVIMMLVRVGIAIGIMSVLAGLLLMVYS